MDRLSWVAKASCSSSEALSFPASSVLRTLKPWSRKSTARRAMMWRSRQSRTKSVSRLGESVMGLFFLSDQRGDVVAMVKEVTERVVDLGLGQTEVFADFLNGFAALMKSGDLPDRYA